MPNPEPFVSKTPSDVLEDRKIRLRPTRWPDASEAAARSRGTGQFARRVEAPSGFRSFRAEFAS